MSNTSDPKPSLLERLARKIEPKPEDMPARSRARLIKQMRHIQGSDKIVHKPNQAPRPTNMGVPCLDGRGGYRFFTDGSLRRTVAKPKTKAERKAAKRARRSHA